MKDAASFSCTANALVGISISSSNHNRNPKTLSKFSLPLTTTISNSSLYTSAIAPPLAYTYYCSGKNVRPGVVASSLSVDSENPSPELAVLLEVEGVLMDVYRLANGQAFNLAFKKLGLDCANWTEPIYLDLLRKAASDEETMLVLFFNRIGWPTSLPTNEKETFTKSVLGEFSFSWKSSEKIVATLHAGAEYAELPVNNCVLIAGSQPGVLGAQRIGMPCIVLRSSLTSRAEFPSADAVMDGFGGADLTLSRLQRMGGC